MRPNVFYHSSKLSVRFFLPFSDEPEHQTRRVTRTTRATAVKENENANTRTSRMVTRSKPAALASGTAGTAGGVTRPTLASKAKATTAESKGEPQVGKRKREALGEVVVAGNKPAVATVKGKEKEVLDGVILKPRAVATRQPLRTVATRQKTTVTIEQDTTKPTEVEKQGVHNDHAMAVDPPTQVPLPSITTRRSNIKARHVSAGVRRVDAGNRVVSQFSSHLKIEEEDEEIGRASCRERV